MSSFDLKSSSVAFFLPSPTPYLPCHVTAATPLSTSTNSPFTITNSYQFKTIPSLSPFQLLLHRSSTATTAPEWFRFRFASGFGSGRSLLSCTSSLSAFTTRKVTVTVIASVSGESSSHSSGTRVMEVAMTSTKALVQRVFETFRWKNQFNINYRVQGDPSNPPILLIHGFGASIQHYKKNIPALQQQGYCVYAIDLLGFGASDKPNLKQYAAALAKNKANSINTAASASGDDLNHGIDHNFVYSLELWGNLVVDFVQYINTQTRNQHKWILVGNSIGSLIALIATTQLQQTYIKSLVLINCAGGLSFVRSEDLNPVLAAIVSVLKFVLFNPISGPWYFENFRTKDNIRKVLKNQRVYHPEIADQAVDDDLIDLLYIPSTDKGATDVFLQIMNGPSGPRPQELLQNLDWCPILLLWGKDDPWTPFEKGLYPATDFLKWHNRLKLVPIEKTGHCPQDERSEVVNTLILDWLRTVD